MVARIVVGFMALAMIFLCSFADVSFGNKPAPKVIPDYAKENFWIALPSRHDIADTIPEGCNTPENQSNALVDVFYIHPTVYANGKDWNANLNNEKVNRLSDTCVLMQATPFNSCARIFAPRYRQGHLKCFTRGGEKGKDALDTAYSDVKKAFEYYLANWNSDRPIILVGHSQGALHIAHLMRDFFDGKPLQKQLVAAYPIGFNEITADYFKHIPTGDSANQTGCFMTWNTVRWGQDTTGLYKKYRKAACVNPLTWRRDTFIAESELHSGAVPFHFKKVRPHAVRTRIYGPILWIEFMNNSHKKGFYHIGDNYHVSDVNLFYMNIRENAELRVKTYLGQRSNK